MSFVGLDLQDLEDDVWELKCTSGVKKFKSRLLIGTGKYKNLEETK